MKTEVDACLAVLIDSTGLPNFNFRTVQFAECSGFKWVAQRVLHSCKPPFQYSSSLLKFPCPQFFPKSTADVCEPLAG